MAHVTFIHGIANKPPADRLLKLWRRNLATGDEPLRLGTEGVTSSMIYWADVLYPEPLADGEVAESLEAVEAEGAEAIEPSWREEVAAEDQAWAAQLEAKLNASLAAEAAAAVPATVATPGNQTHESLERIPLPWFVKERLMEALLRDVHHYLFNVTASPRPGVRYAVQEELRRRFLAGLVQGATEPGPHVVVSHSMGTVIAYDCLKRVPGCPRVDALVTIGSPLGLDEIQDKLRPGWSRNDGYPREQIRGHWINVYDRLDPVTGFDPSLANDYRWMGDEIVRDIHEPNHGRWRHDIAKYLGGPRLRGALREVSGLPPAEAQEI